jgi:aminomethyltransferase
LALVQSSVQEGDVLSVDVRGRALSVTVTKPPFVQPSTK